MANTADPDQLASSEEFLKTIWIYTFLQRYIWVQQDKGECLKFFIVIFFFFFFYA